MKNGKAAGLEEKLPEVWKTRKIDDILLRYCNAVYNQNIGQRAVSSLSSGRVTLELPRTTDTIFYRDARGVMVMDTATRVQILDETDCISHSTNTLGKGMNLIILPPAMGK